MKAKARLSIDESSTLPNDELAQQFTVALVNRCGELVELGEATHC
jgi:hypothetical protein